MGQFYAICKGVYSHPNISPALIVRRIDRYYSPMKNVEAAVSAMTLTSGTRIHDTELMRGGVMIRGRIH